jgi:hypothetical protein
MWDAQTLHGREARATRRADDLNGATIAAAAEFRVQRRPQGAPESDEPTRKARRSRSETPATASTTSAPEPTFARVVRDLCGAWGRWTCGPVASVSALVRERMRAEMRWRALSVFVSKSGHITKF